MGTRFHELEEMGGTTALGILAIKNNLEAFTSLLKMCDDPKISLNLSDLYGNTPLHYWALRGAEASGVLGYLEELGGNPRARNLAGDEVWQVARDRKITCKEPNVDVGACFCASRLLISVVRV